MTRRHLVIVAIVVLAASILSALVGYRGAIRRSRSAAAFSGARAGSGAEDCVDFREAGSHTGETRCITGRIARVFTSRSDNTFLDFCADYRHCPFTSVIFSSDRSKFGDLETLGGRRVELEGPITVYEGRAEIVIHDPQQIHVLP